MRPRPPSYARKTPVDCSALINTAFTMCPHARCALPEGETSEKDLVTDTQHGRPSAQAFEHLFVPHMKRSPLFECSDTFAFPAPDGKKTRVPGTRFLDSNTISINTPPLEHVHFREDVEETCAECLQLDPCQGQFIGENEVCQACGWKEKRWRYCDPCPQCERWEELQQAIQDTFVLSRKLSERDRIPFEEDLDALNEMLTQEGEVRTITNTIPPLHLVRPFYGTHVLEEALTFVHRLQKEIRAALPWYRRVFA